MRAVNRKSVIVPDAMSGKDSPAIKELQKLQAYFDVPKGKLPAFAVYKSDSVKKQLNELFHGKCAYCESFYYGTAPVDIEHYRPKGSVYEDLDHPGYWWIAMDWDNLLPSCIHCNRRSGQVTLAPTTSLVSLVNEGRELSRSRVIQTGKQDSFPILGERAAVGALDFAAEQALLLDPCRDSPQEHLRFHVDSGNLIGLVLPKSHDSGGLDLATGVAGVRPELREVIEQALSDKLSLRGAVSIHVYGLNRLGLVQERTRVLRQLEFLEMLSVEMGLMAQDLDPGPTGPVAEESEQKNLGRDRRIAKRLRFLQEQILGQMKAMARPEAPYSVMVREWIEGFKVRLSS
ncbi:HNH endonuclease [Pseudomonas fuscovaginae UPB0736]|uniref:HNH endonuclease n=1 Tax=Pseudomonas asplenii TaxID=53407 RepID=UPI0002894D30|nr:HNH endonuclease [Pseudomonas fuscovaginae]UUQ65316.1 HNH endonuclease [Pseudomonas fuscovaginae UPB0736]